MAGPNLFLENVSLLSGTSAEDKFRGKRRGMAFPIRRITPGDHEQFLKTIYKTPDDVIQAARKLSGD